MQKAELGTATLVYRVFGNGPVQVIIEGALNSCNAEWWPLCRELEGVTVLVYDRAGYGLSTPSTLPRSPLNIVLELEKLLAGIELAPQIVLLGHSQGGLYTTLFGLRNADRVKGMILLDPLSVSDSRFKQELNETEYQASGVDKTSALKIGSMLCSLGLAFLFKGLLKKAPPFYYRSFSKDEEQYILSALVRKKQYLAALAEYSQAHVEENLVPFSGKLYCPVYLLRHNPEIMQEEIVHFGACSPELAVRIEALWQSVMTDMLAFSTRGESRVAPNSSHYIHLSDQTMVVDLLKSLVGDTP